MTGSADLLIGTYAHLGGRGACPLHLRDGTWTLGDPLPAIADASWGVRMADGGYLFVGERDEGEVLRTDAALTVTNRFASGGAAPCHLAMAPDGCRCAVANYGDGRVALLDPDTGRRIDHASDGHGPNAQRQEGPHAHWVGFDPDRGRLHSIDLGSDAIRALALDGDSFGDAATVYLAPAGSGPRHLAWHRWLSVAYLISELAATLTILDRTGETWRARAILPTLPPGVDADTLGGAIALNAAGDRLYVTNRGHDSIVAFAVDADGDLSYLDHCPSGGASPRFLLPLEDIAALVVANEEGGNIGIVSLDPHGGFSGEMRTIAIPGAVFAIRTDQEFHR